MKEIVKILFRTFWQPTYVFICQLDLNALPWAQSHSRWLWYVSDLLKRDMNAILKFVLNDRYTCLVSPHKVGEFMITSSRTSVRGATKSIMSHTIYLHHVTITQVM